MPPYNWILGNIGFACSIECQDNSLRYVGERLHWRLCGVVDFRLLNEVISGAQMCYRSVFVPAAPDVEISYTLE